MKKLLLALITLSVLASCTDTRDLELNEPLVISNDGGGQLISAEADRAKLKSWGGEVQLRGYCASACVIFTTLPNACLGPNARIGFHSANLSVPFLIGDAQMSRYLRGEIKKNYDRTWSKSSDMHWISAKEYVELDPLAKICE